MNKRIWLIAAATLSILATTAFANTKALNDLNLAIQKLLQPLQNPQTVATFSFSDIQTDAKNALAVRLNAFLSKQGSVNNLVFRLDDLGYNYNNGVDPITSGKGSVELDLTKIFSAQELNEFAADLEHTVQSFAKDYINRYGAAVDVKATISNKVTDAAGNVTAIDGVLSFNIDMTKLPVDVDPSEIMFVRAKLIFSADFKRRIELSGEGISNIKYYAFAEDSAGLKDLLDQALALDPDTLAQLEEFMRMIDSNATDIAEGRY